MIEEVIKETAKKATASRPEIIDKKDRKTLIEGRNYNMGFAMLSRLSDSQYETVMPITACKDFLNEIIYTEASGIPSQCWGMRWDKKIGLFDQDPNYAFMAITILPYSTGKRYPKQEEDEKQLHDNHTKMEMLMEYVDLQMGVGKDFTTKILRTTTEGLYLVKVPKFWVQYTYLTSLYTLILRMAQTFDQKKSIKEFLDSYNLQPDYGLWTAAKPKFEKLKTLIKEGKALPTQDFATKWCPHNVGIVTFNF